jgi:hypothetical protein
MGDPTAKPTTLLAAAVVDATSPTAVAEVEERSTTPSRSSARRAIAPVKRALLSQVSGGQFTKVLDLTSEDPREIAAAMLAEYGFGAEQFTCLDSLWSSESNWRVTAENVSSGAYGIPQALPGSKMASAGADWATSAETQIRWGLGYIGDRYGDPCGAWEFKHSNGWY